MKSFIICTSNQLKEDEMGRTCNMHRAMRTT